MKAKLELCLILQYLYDMYTDTRLKAIVARYRELYITHVENKLWRKKDMTAYEQTMPFDKPDVPDDVDGSVELPRALHRQYPGLASDYCYAQIFERLCMLDLKPVLTDADVLFATTDPNDEKAEVVHMAGSKVTDRRLSSAALRDATAALSDRKRVDTVTATPAEAPTATP